VVVDPFHFRAFLGCFHRYLLTDIPTLVLGLIGILQYRLVLETLEPLTGDRKCFRMINGVLVERTVKDVVPALQTNSEGLKKVLEELMKSYRSKNVEMESWKVSGKFCYEEHNSR
jgi:hypothetical protein